MSNLEVILYIDKLNRRFLQLKPSDNSKFNVESVKVSIFSSYAKKFYLGNNDWTAQETFFEPCTATYPSAVYFGTANNLSVFVPNSPMKITAGDLEWTGKFPNQSENWNDEIPNEEFWVGEQVIQINSDSVESTEGSKDNTENNELSEIGNNIIDDANENYVRKPRNWKRYWLVSALIALAVLLFAFWPNVYSIVENFDIGEIFGKKSQCTTESTNSKTIVLFDGTDEFSRSYSSKVKICLNRFVESVPLQGLLELRLMDNKENEGKVMFSKCNSGNSDWSSSYNEAIDQTLNSLEQVAESDATPVLKWLQLVSQIHFKDFDYSQNNKLIMVSDMIEHSSDFSHIDGSPYYTRFEKSEAFNKFKTDFQGTEVEFCMLNRKGSNINLRELIDFWSLWIKENDGFLNRQAVK